MASPGKSIGRMARMGLPGLLFGFFLTAFPSDILRFTPADTPRDTLRIRGFETTFLPKLDPAKGEMVFITQQLFDGLVRLDADLKVVPDLAEYWDISEGGKCYTFYLRKGVRFHDGEEVTAADVLFSLTRILRRNIESPFARYLIEKVVGAEDFALGKASQVAGFQILDPYIFEVKWKNPYVSALSLLSMSYCRILPRKAMEKQGRNFFFNPVGSGPFKFDGWLRSPQLEILGIRLIRNLNYFGRIPRIAAVEFSPFFTFDHFAARDVDVMPYSEDLARLGCQIVEGGNVDLVYLMMSCANPPFDRPWVRRAMSMIIDKEKLAQASASASIHLRPSDHFIPSKLPGFFPDIASQTPNPGGAFRMIEEEEGRFRVDEFPEIILYIPAAGKMAMGPIARELSRQFSALGFSLETKTYRALNELKDVRRPFFVLWDRGMDYPDAENVIQPLFGKSSNLRWLTGEFPGDDFDRLLESAGLEAGRAKRLQLFREMEQILRREVPGIPLFTIERRMAVQNNVRGLRIPLLGVPYIDLREAAFLR